MHLLPYILQGEGQNEAMRTVRLICIRTFVSPTKYTDCFHGDIYLNHHLANLRQMGEPLNALMLIMENLSYLYTYSPTIR